MLQTAPNSLIMGGHQPLLVSFDLETRQEIQQVAEFACYHFLVLETSFSQQPSYGCHAGQHVLAITPS